MRVHPSPLTLHPAALCLLAASAHAVTVTVHPAARQLQGAGTCTLTWTVTGSADPRVTFQVLEPESGTVDAEGRYTAPPVVLAERTIHVRGTSVADGTAHADAEILLLPNRLEMTLPGVHAPGDAAILMGKLFGEDWLGGHSGRLPFLDLASGERFGDGKDRVVTWQLDEAIRRARMEARSIGKSKFYCGYSMPANLAWIPMPHAEAQMLSLRIGTEVTRLDVTGARSRELRFTDRVLGASLEALRPAEDKGTWLSDSQEMEISVSGVLPLAGSLRGNPGQRDGDGPAARFMEPSGLAWLGALQQAAVADPAAHCVSLVDPAGRVRRLCGLPDEPGDRDGTPAEARFRAPAHLAVGSDPDGSRGGPLGPFCLYVADRESHVIRRIRANGTVETYAGVPGRAGFLDSDDARQALFDRPQGIAVTSDGSLLVADRGNHRLRLIVPATAEHGPRVRTLAGSGAVGAEDGPALQASFTELGGLCSTVYGTAYVTDGNAVREIQLEPAGVSTLLGSVAKAGYLDTCRVEGQDAPQLKDVPCLDHPTSIVEQLGELVILDAGNRALRFYNLSMGYLTTTTGPSRAPDFAYGLLTCGIEGPLPPGFAFSGLGSPRALCLASTGGYADSLILSTEHRLAWVEGGVQGDPYGPGFGAFLEAVAARSSPPAAGGERKDPAGPATATIAVGAPCPVRFQFEQFGASPYQLTYAVQWVDPDGSVAKVVSGRCATGAEQVAAGLFRQGGRGKVLLTWVTDEGGCGSRSVTVLVR